MNSHARVLTIALVLQAVLFYSVASRAERIPVTRPLNDFPTYVNGWQIEQQLQIDKEVQDILKADDTLNRIYVNPPLRAGANLFVAFFKTQRAGQAPHSPKNCLPGSGWVPSATGFIDVNLAGGESIKINRYVVSHGEEKSVVLYWYQSPHRVVASEYWAKIWLVADSIRYHRSDTALVRVVVPVRNNDEESATRVAVTFVQSVFPELRRQLPM